MRFACEYLSKSFSYIYDTMTLLRCKESNQMTSKGIPKNIMYPVQLPRQDIIVASLTAEDHRGPNANSIERNQVYEIQV